MGDISEQGSDLKSPILNAGQNVITGMKLTTGVGDPEAGVRFGEGADLMSGAGKTLQTAYPDASWESNSSNFYAARNNDQLGYAETVIGADNLVVAVLARESEQIATTRDNLDAQSDWLADMSLITMATGFIPYVGQAAKIAAEIAIVAKAVGVSTDELMTMQQNADANAAELQTAVQLYASVGSQPKPETGTTPPPAKDGEDDSDEMADETADETEPDAQEADSAPVASPAGAPPAGPTGGGGGTGPGGGAPAPRPSPASSPMPTSSTMPNMQPAAPATGGGDLAGVMAGLVGAILAPLGGILGGVTQAATGAVQATTQAATGAVQAATQAAGHPQTPPEPGAEAEKLDGAKDGKTEDKAGKSAEPKTDPKADEDPGTNSERDKPHEGAGAVGPTDDDAAKTLPPDLTAAAGDNGGGGRAPVHIELDLERDQLSVPVTVRLDPVNPGSATVTRA